MTYIIRTTTELVTDKNIIEIKLDPLNYASKSYILTRQIKRTL